MATATYGAMTIEELANLWMEHVTDGVAAECSRLMIDPADVEHADVWNDAEAEAWEALRDQYGPFGYGETEEEQVLEIVSGKRDSLPSLVESRMEEAQDA